MPRGQSKLTSTKQDLLSIKFARPDTGIGGTVSTLMFPVKLAPAQISGRIHRGLNQYSLYEQEV